jgi:uncharacterized protein YndB with AHSA1/START domain
MAEILHDICINSSPTLIFKAISTPEGFNNWWTNKCSGVAKINEEFNFYFSEEYNWFAKVSKYSSNEAIEFSMTIASECWEQTSFGFLLTEVSSTKTQVQFYHKNWNNTNKEFRTTSYCWAHILYFLKNYIENGIIVPFENRNNHI